MTRIWILLLLGLCFSAPQPITAQDAADPFTPPQRPLAVTTETAGDLLLERYFTTLQQGQVGILRLVGDITDARALLRGNQYPFIQGDDAWYSFIIADLDAQPRDYALSVLVRLPDGSTTTFDSLVTVVSSAFVRQLFEVPPQNAYLINPAIERGEYARIDAIIATITPQRFWQDSGWQLPIDAPYTSNFGQYRILNQSVQTRHTGWDQSAPVGTPVGAMAAGKVVFAAQLDIRGNYILIDHGWGIYTGYAHFSQVNVVAGQTVERGQIIGFSGNTGRSSGPHLHWEVAINGEWVDGALFLEAWLPY